MSNKVLRHVKNYGKSAPRRNPNKCPPIPKLTACDSHSEQRKQRAPMNSNLSCADADRVVDLTVAHKAAGMRLDQYLVSLFPDFSRSLIQKAIEAGSVTVNESATKASYKIRLGDKTRLGLPEPSHDIAVPEDIPLDILYQDEYLAVINKPYDMVVHPAKGHW